MLASNCVLTNWLAAQVSAEFVSPCGTLLLRCTGSSLAAPGWLAAWADWDRRAATAGADTDADTDAGEAAAAAGVSSTDEDDDITAAGGSGKAALSQVLQQLQEGQQVLLSRVLPGQHFTKPPARYSEASMIKMLEEVGVGRPSTYAPIIRKLLVSPGWGGCAVWLDRVKGVNVCDAASSRAACHVPSCGGAE